MTSLASGREVRLACRSGALDGQTSGLAPGFVQGNLAILPKDVAEVWLTSFNAHLGAVPVDVLRTRGALPVVAAIEVEAQEAYA